MDFNLTQEQTQLADTLKRWVSRDYSFERRKDIIHSETGISEQAWTGLAELGLMALPVPEEFGGFSASGADLMVVMQELGKGLIVEPYLPTLCGLEFLRLAGDQHGAILEAAATGSLKLACALGEAQSRYDLFDIATTAEAIDGHYILNGRKTVVVGGAQADYLIVSARTGGGQRDTDGISLFLVGADVAGLDRQDYRTIDGMRAADIEMSNLRLPASALIGTQDGGWALVDAVSDFAVSLLCAEALGIMEALCAATLDYLKTRHQFGEPIGRFQALQHRMAEMFIELEQARSMAMLAAAKVRSGDADERRSTISGAMIRVGQAARRVGQDAIQLHGGIGMTNELPTAHYFKRLTMIGSSFGDVDHHVARFVAQPAFRETT